MKISKGKQNKIKCMVTKERGKYKVFYDEFEELANSNKEVVTIYYPTRKQKLEIAKFMFENTKKADSQYTLMLLKELTDIVVDLDVKKDKEIIEDLFNNPSDFLILVQNEIFKIIETICKDTIQDINKLAKHLKIIKYRSDM